jgi:hypothetical protein
MGPQVQVFSHTINIISMSLIDTAGPGYEGHILESLISK